ncbi:MAG: pyridoxamine 5'-phosphate oxidase [Chthoniobacterales bacterium]
MDFISSQHQDYCKGILRRTDLRKDPIAQFDAWFQEAVDCDTVTEPNAMALSTTNCDLHVTSRMVLLKGYDKNGFRFFTNSTSLKGKQIAENPHVALLFYWPSLERQIKICGTASPLPHQETEEYFHARPRKSQLAAWASFQSMTLPNRQALESRMLSLQKKFKNQEIPTPDFWSGYLVAPQSIEFWQGRENRLHDCFRYLKKESDWIIERLNP